MRSVGSQLHNITADPTRVKLWSTGIQCNDSSIDLTAIRKLNKLWHDGIRQIGNIEGDEKVSMPLVHLEIARNNQQDKHNQYKHHDKNGRANSLILQIMIWFEAGSKTGVNPPWEPKPDHDIERIASKSI